MTETGTDASGAVTGITDQELTALVEGGWCDAASGLPRWGRMVEAGDGERIDQRVFPSIFAGWSASSYGENEFSQGGLTFDGALAWCDERAGGRKPAKPGSATKQEDHFPRWPAGQR